MSAEGTREHVHSVDLPATPEAVFALLHTPSAIRAWWSAARAVVVPKTGGTWAAAWGEDEDDPDYVSTATMSVFDPPRRIVFTDYEYAAKAGPLPFEADFTTEFAVEPIEGGARLTVRQSGFPAGPEADAFYAGCEQGWRDTFDAVARFVEAARSGAAASGETA